MEIPTGILIVIAVVYLGLAVAAASVASVKGRSGWGWFVLGLIFPIAILFVAAASPYPGKDSSHEGELGTGERSGKQKPPPGKQKPSPWIGSIWNRVIRHQGDKFCTKRNLEFTYHATEDGLVTSLTKTVIPKRSFEVALSLVPFDGPGEISGKVIGSAYVWAILHDDRIRQDDY